MMTTDKKAVRFADALAYTGLKRTHAYDLMAQGFFPKPLKVGRTSLWLVADLDKWLADRAAARAGEARHD